MSPVENDDPLSIDALGKWIQIIAVLSRKVARKANDPGVTKELRNAALSLEREIEQLRAAISRLVK